jgi:WD40 repeat protein
LTSYRESNVGASEVSIRNPRRSDIIGVTTPDRDTYKKSSLNSVSSPANLKPTTCLVRDDHIHSGLFAFHEDSKLLFSCGHWDHSFKVTAVETGKMIQSIAEHRDVITCLSLSVDFYSTWLVTGSRDCTVMIWEVLPERESSPVTMLPLYTLFGHDDAVTSICVCPKLNIVISGSDDGTLIVHTLREGTYVRSIVVGPVESPSVQSATDNNETSAVERLSTQQESSNISNIVSKRRINWIGVTYDGFIVVYLMDDRLLCTYSVNGRFLATRSIKDKLHALLLSTDGKVLVTGGNNGLVVLRWVSVETM